MSYNNILKMVTFWNLLVLSLSVTMQVNLTSGNPVTQPPLRSPPIPSKTPTSLNSGLFNDSKTTPTCTTMDIDEWNSGYTLRTGLVNVSARWKNFDVIPNPNIEQWELDLIKRAMWNLWEVIPCVNFWLYHSSSKPIGDYLRLVKDVNNGCNSHVGKRGGEQIVNLEYPKCYTVEVIMHEFVHALGFYHEQSRDDRDDYVDIYWDKIQPRYKFAFEKQRVKLTTFGVPYDYNSVMHYDAYQFPIVDGDVTLAAKNGQRIGPIGKLTDKDIQRLKLMYKC